MTSTTTFENQKGLNFNFALQIQPSKIDPNSIVQDIFAHIISSHDHGSLKTKRIKS